MHTPHEDIKGRYGSPPEETAAGDLEGVPENVLQAVRRVLHQRPIGTFREEEFYGDSLEETWLRSLKSDMARTYLSMKESFRWFLGEFERRFVEGKKTQDLAVSSMLAESLLSMVDNDVLADIINDNMHDDPYDIVQKALQQVDASHGFFRHVFQNSRHAGIKMQALRRYTDEEELLREILAGLDEDRWKIHGGRIHWAALGKDLDKESEIVRDRRRAYYGAEGAIDALTQEASLRAVLEKIGDKDTVVASSSRIFAKRRLIELGFDLDDEK